MIYNGNNDDDDNDDTEENIDADGKDDFKIAFTTIMSLCRPSHLPNEAMYQP